MHLNKSREKVAEKSPEYEREIIAYKLLLFIVASIGAAVCSSVPIETAVEKKIEKEKNSQIYDMVLI